MFTQISPKISAIPTTLITGFLGVGKTTAILQLLANKPKDENWAVLVNEFGEIGIDSALLDGNSNEKGVFIREVPGGCMCCASGVPMQVALNQLITKSKPDRLLIEPTGLGHPKEVVEVLTKGKFQETISLQSILCLVDARNLIDERYTKHPSFVQQLKVADTILAAKADTYSAQDEENLSSFISDNKLTDKPLHLMQQGKIDPNWLVQQPKTVIVSKPIIGIAASSLQESSHEIEIGYKKEREQSQALQTKLAQEGFIELNNHGEGYFSKGWVFSDKYTFDYQQLITLITSLSLARVKGVVITEQGSYSFNKAGSEFSCNKITDSKDSRIELIDTNKSALNNLTSEQLLMLKKDFL
ncbi:GTP-binding protein [Colwellia demingiae]|uniref:GTP-binding protein n=1 Tax=Colwellia demingiae TaxID=89401 RepID=A0A5C6QMF6_9GAMM|nr:GTP-binding protein [Colwellia demingiae]TWX69692.1 GTP-binding protein [Colwellia demingiae]